MEKTMVLPLIGLLCLLIKSFSGIDIDLKTQEDVGNAFLVVSSVGATLYGIIKNHKKKVLPK